MRTSRSVVASGLLVLAVATAGCGNQAVSSSSSMDALGRRLTTDATTVVRGMAGTLNAQESVSRGAESDVTCSCGRLRDYRAHVTAPVSQAGSELNNVESLAAQSLFKPLGYRLTTDVSGSVPATLHFENKPGSPDQLRRFTTKVTRSGSSFTWTLSGRTACIKE